MNDNHIKLIKSTFFREETVKEKLLEFLRDSKVLSMGEKCIECEKAFAEFHNRKYAVLFSSGSSANLALIQASMNTGLLKKGDKVAFSSLTWSTNVMPLIQLGLIPIPVDAEISTLNVGSKGITDVLDKNPDIKAFFISNILGFCSDIDVIEKICTERGVLFLEDNCESFGTVYKNKLLGSFGFASTTSLFVGHHLSAIEGGVVFTDDYELWNMLKMVRAHGWDRNLDDEKQKELREKNSVENFYALYTFYDLGYNLRPTEITGFLALHQLSLASEIIKRRAENFKIIYSASLNNDSIHHLDVQHIEYISNFAFPMIFKTKEKFDYYREKFSDNKVEIRPIVGGDMTQQPFFKKYVKEEYYMPNTTKIHSNGFYCPNNPELTNEEVERIALIISE